MEKKKDYVYECAMRENWSEHQIKKKKATQWLFQNTIDYTVEQ